MLRTLLKKKKATRLASTTFYRFLSFDFYEIQLCLQVTNLVIIIKTDNDKLISDYLVRLLRQEKKKNSSKEKGTEIVHDQLKFQMDELQ